MRVQGLPAPGRGAGTAGSIPRDLACLGNELLFSAVSSSQGRELFRSDGTAAGTVLVAQSGQERKAKIDARIGALQEDYAVRSGKLDPSHASALVEDVMRALRGESPGLEEQAERQLERNRDQLLQDGRVARTAH